jgi:gas vesicle protein
MVIPAPCYRSYLHAVKIFSPFKLSDMKNSSKVLIALGAGLAIGGLMGVLFAPAKGTETRKKMTDAGNKLTDSVKDSVNKGKEKIAGLKEGIRERVSSLIEKAEEFA